MDEDFTYWRGKLAIHTTFIMVFTGTVSTNRGQIFVLGDIEFDGDCGGTIDNVTTLKGKNTATLSGFMIDSRGISITAPDVSSNYYR